MTLAPRTNPGKSILEPAREVPVIREYDVLVVVEGKDLYDVARFVAEKLSTMDVVLSTATHFQLRSYKHDGFMLNHPTTDGPLPVSP